MPEDNAANPATGQPAEGTLQGVATDQPEWQKALDGVPVKEILHYTVTKRKDEKFMWGSKDPSEWTPEEFARVAAGNKHLDQRAAALKTEQERWELRKGQEVANGVAEFLRNFPELGTPATGQPAIDAANPATGQPAEGTLQGVATDQPVTPDQQNAAANLEKSLENLAPKVQQALAKELGFESIQDLKTELNTLRQGFKDLRNTTNRAYYNQLAERYPILQWHKVGDHEEPVNKVAYMAWSRYVDSEMAPEAAAELVNKELSSSIETEYQRRLQEQFDKGELARPGPTGNLPKPETYDGRDGVSGLFKRQKAESENEGLAPPGVKGNWAV